MFEFDKTVSFNSLYHAWEKIKTKNSKACGIDDINLSTYSKKLENNINTLRFSLISNLYEPYKEKMYISKKRNIFISCIDDKIVQTAIAQTLSELINFHSNVHSFIKGRSIFTAHSELKKFIKEGNNTFYKIDIKKFYESIPRQLLINKIEQITDDKRFLSLIKKVIWNHNPGISTGSALSPVLSNIFMTDFDYRMSKKLNFYIRYVDDILLSPKTEKSLSDIIIGTNQELEKIGLVINNEKSNVVEADTGFKYLGFDIKNHNKIDKLIQNNNLSELENLLQKKQSEETILKTTLDNEELPDSKKENNDNAIEKEHSNPETNNFFPKYILAIEKNCHMVNYMINKAKTENFLSHPEKRVLLYIYYVLGKKGEEYLHNIFSNCIDYNYNITQSYIDRCRLQQPIGCRKICDTFEDVCDKTQCYKCNFSQEKIYPTPVIYAMRKNKDCFKLPEPSENIGHFKKLPPKQGVQAILAKTIELNKKSHEIKTQQTICQNRLEQLFERNNFTELDTPYGLLIKNEDGIFIKIS